MSHLHSHPCACCGTPTPCDGSLERNDDGFPSTICALYHLPFGSVNPDCRCESCAAVEQRASDLQPTSVDELHEVGAAVIFGLDTFCAVRLAFHHENWSAARSVWASLTPKEQQRYIDTAAAVLETFRPHAPAGQREIVTGLGGVVIGAITPKES